MSRYIASRACARQARLVSTPMVVVTHARSRLFRTLSSSMFVICFYQFLRQSDISVLACQQTRTFCRRFSGLHEKYISNWLLRFFVHCSFRCVHFKRRACFANSTAKINYKPVSFNSTLSEVCKCTNDSILIPSVLLENPVI